MNKYVVLGGDTHFTYDEKTTKVWCTHGSWGGTLKIYEDGSCSVAKVKFDRCVFTEAKDYDEAKSLGLIDNKTGKDC